MPRDLTAGLVVFLVALPLCLGIALASGAPLFSGILAGIVGGLVVGVCSGSHTSVSGPAAGLTAIVIAQIAALGSFDTFLLAVALAGVMQVGLGLAKAGELSSFFPTSVIKGLLAAIGVILILKQIPHLVGHDSDPEGEMSFIQPDEETTFSELATLIAGEMHLGAAVIGITSIALLIFWGRIKPLKESIFPAPLAAVLLGVGMKLWFDRLGGSWTVGTSHLVDIPMADSFNGFLNFLTFPAWSEWNNPKVYLAAVTIAIVASLETLLNLEAVDELDPQRRHSPPSRELVAQGAGNIVSGLIGGLPVTSVIIRGSVNVNMGVQTKLSTIFHGTLLLTCVALMPQYLNLIPLSALAAILLVTGFKLASPALFRQMWEGGRYQFVPFLVTLSAIVLTDLLVGIIIGLAVSACFILNSNLRRPVRRVVDTHLGNNVLQIDLASQVSFLNRAALDKLFNEAERGTHLVIDGSHSDYIDPDILGLIRDFKYKKGPAHGVDVRLRGFRKKYHLPDDDHVSPYASPELQEQVKPEEVLEILREGNRRFRTGEHLTRDLGRVVEATATRQTPLALILGCIDSRVPVEIVFDLGIGDVFGVRDAGNVVGAKTLGSIEYGVKLRGIKLVLVLGHTRCGSVRTAIKLLSEGQEVEQATGCDHLHAIVDEIQHSIEPEELTQYQQMTEVEREALVDDVVRRNALRSVREIVEQSAAIHAAVEAEQVMVVAAVYDIKTGEIDFLPTDALAIS